MLAAEMQFGAEVKPKLPASPEIPSVNGSAVTTSRSDGAASPSINSPTVYELHHSKDVAQQQHSETQTTSWMSNGTAIRVPGDQSVHGSPVRLPSADLSAAGGSFSRSPKPFPALFKPAPPVSTHVPRWKPLDTPSSPAQNGLHLLLRVCEALDPAGTHSAVLLGTAVGRKRSASPDEVLCRLTALSDRRASPAASAAKRVRRTSTGSRSGGSERATISGPCTNPDCERPLVSPQWRKGPPSHPILCNACGTRWLRNGTLKPLVPRRGLRYKASKNGGSGPAKPSTATPSSAATSSSEAHPTASLSSPMLPTPDGSVMATPVLIIPPASSQGMTPSPGTLLTPLHLPAMLPSASPVLTPPTATCAL